MSFSKELTFFAEKTGKRLENTVRSVVSMLGETLVFRSPVGDANYWKRPAPPGYVGGHFRANWQYSFSSPMSGEVDSVSKQTSLDSIKKVKTSQAFGVHYVVNNTPYSIKIENGWARQAPNGVLKLTVMNFNNFLRESANEERNK